MVKRCKLPYNARMNNVLKELHLALVFMTRLPLPPLSDLPEGGLARSMRLFPLVGLVVGGLSAAAYALIHLALPSSLAALAALAAGLWVTGCLHEDGLADVADGFGGGRDKERKLEIMRDSRIGSYGVVAVAMSLLIRAAALASFPGSWSACAALVAAHALSRAVIPGLMQWLEPARADGLGQGAGQPSSSDALCAGLLAMGCAVLLLPLATAVAAGLAATVGAAVIGHLAKKHIGGHTGDVLGGCEQAAEVCALLAILAVGS